MGQISDSRKARTNVFTRHPRGAEILEKLLAEEITQTKAAEILNCSIANISIYLKKLRKKKKDKFLQLQPRPKQKPPKKNKTTKEITPLEFESEEDLTKFGIQIWRNLLLQLIDLVNNSGELTKSEAVKLIKEIRHFLQFDFKEGVPEIEEKQITIDPEAEKIIIEKIIGDMCATCQYRKEFNCRKLAEQNKTRMVSG